MIIVPNIHCKKALESKTNLPILLLPHYIQSLVDQTPYMIATSSIIQYYLYKLCPDNIDICNQHINHILEYNLQSIKSIQPNTQWIFNITQKLLSQLKEHNLIHPKDIYTHLLNVNLQYDAIRYYGFSNIPPNLQAFFEHYEIQEFKTASIQPSESFFQFLTVSSEIEQAIQWLNNKSDSAIVYLDSSYKEGLLRHQSLHTPLNHNIASEITQAIPQISISSLTYLSHNYRYPKGLNLLAYLSLKYYNTSIQIDYLSIHYQAQISQEAISYKSFFTIMQDILLDWRLEIPKSLYSLQSLDFLHITMSYQKWHALCFRTPPTSNFSLPIYSPKEVEGARFSQIWILGAHQSRWRHRSNLPWLSNLSIQDFNYLQNIADNIIYSCQTMSTDGERLHFYREAPIEQPQVNHSIPTESIIDNQVTSLEKIKANATLIQDYTACPFKAFAKYRLKLENKQHHSHDMEKKDYGIIMHSLLEKLYEDIQHQADLESLDLKIIPTLIQKAWAPYSFIHPDLAKILTQRIHQSILQWIEKDLSRDEFSIIALEHKSKLSIGNYTLNLRIDRIDKSKNQSIIVDYKTGHIHINESLSPYFTSPHMLLYALTQDYPPQIAYAKPLQKQAIYQSLDLSNLDDYDILSQEWINKAQYALSQYQAGKHPVLPVHDKVCEHCDFKALCRYALGDNHAG